MNNSEQFLVSICCITYNHEKYIHQCLDGFMMQKCDFDFEVLIHDDASTDRTQKIIKEYQNKYPNIIKPILRQENLYSKGIKGLNKKFNFSRAKGKYIAMCEGDDYWTDPLKLQKQVDFLESNQDVVMCYHNRSICRFNGEIEEAPFKMFNNLKQNKIIESKDMIDVFMPFLTIMFRKDCINEYIKIDQMGVFGGDTFLRAFLSTKGKAAYLHFNGAVYRQHEGGIFSSLNDKIGKCKKAIQTRELILERIPNVYRKTVYKSLFKNYSVLFLNYLRSKKIGKAIKIIPLIVKYFFKFL